MKDFGAQARRKQGEFRDSSLSITSEGRSPDDEKGLRNGHLLALGHEKENLYPPLRSPTSAEAFFAARDIKWWRSARSGGRRYSDLYSATDSRFTGQVPLDELFYEPFYQIMRLGLLGDKMVREREFGVTEAKVVVICPEENKAYRNTITSPFLKARFPDATNVQQPACAVLRLGKNFSITSPVALVAAVRQNSIEGNLSEWLAYQHERYGY
jgi:hypothetical protein